MSSATNRILSIAKFLVFSSITSIALVCILEFIGSLYLNQFKNKEDFRVNSDPMKGQEWSSKYFSELNKSRSNLFWKPFVYFRKKQFQGEYININSDGIRNSYNQKGDNRIKVFTFGGSAMWGTGSRDMFTIPSLLSKELEKMGINAEVSNFGEMGRTINQELIELTQELVKGNIPDLVIFYDSVNDLHSYIDSNVVGVSINESNRELEFNLSRPNKFFSHFRYMLRNYYLPNSSIVKIYNRIKGKRNEHSKEKLQNFDANKLLQHYQNTILLIQSLSKSYNFNVSFFWQPAIFTKKNLSRTEKIASSKRRDLKKPFIGISKKIELNISNFNSFCFYNLAYLFKDEKRPIYIDWSHINEEGNLAVAKAIIQGMSKCQQLKEFQP